MATLSNTICDLCGVHADKKQIKVPVTFYTEQTEGRNSKPYIAIETLDFCDKCLNTVIINQPISAWGAQGNNTYKLKDTQ